MKLFTIGFTKKSAEVFFTRLQEAGVKWIVDVRLNNVSQLEAFRRKTTWKIYCSSAPTRRMRNAWMCFGRPRSTAEKGLDTVIGEGGVKVSGGEKQRLSIARALLRKPQLLVFDEARSSLNSLTGEEISQMIRELASSRDAITILIAHRLSTVLHADRIYVLERGHIVEFGRHEELIERKGLYYAMWRQQVREGRLAPAAAGREMRTVTA